MTSSIEHPHGAEKEVAERLRSYRTDSGMEIAELAVRTRITPRHIAALEEGRFQFLPGPVFVRGFIKSICRELGRDHEQLFVLLDGVSDEEPQEEADLSYGTRKPIPLILSGVVLAVLVVGGILIHGGGSEEKGSGSENGAVQGFPEGSAAESPDGQQVDQDVVREFDLLIRATDRTWLRIQPDNAEPWETTMRAGDEIALKATERVNLFIGNAGGVLFELNGKRFGPPGAQGQVISNYTITRDEL